MKQGIELNILSNKNQAIELSNIIKDLIAHIAKSKWTIKRIELDNYNWTKETYQKIKKKAEYKYINYKNYFNRYIGLINESTFKFYTSPNKTFKSLYNYTEKYYNEIIELIKEYKTHTKRTEEEKEETLKTIKLIEYYKQ